jgi:hypothetical protein
MVDMALEIPCPYCGSQMYAEQAHNRCPTCRYIEPCCDGAPQAVCETRAPERPAAAR